MKHLIPIDGSTASLRAVAELLREHKGQTWTDRSGQPSVVLLSVQPLFSRHASRFIPAAERRRFRDERAQQSLRPASDLLRPAGVPFASMTAEGEVSEVVLREAARLGVDQIVLGVLRKPAWMRRLMPSISQRILNGAQVPVAVISQGHPGPVARYAVPAGLGLGLTMLMLGD